MSWAADPQTWLLYYSSIMRTKLLPSPGVTVSRSHNDGDLLTQKAELADLAHHKVGNHIAVDSDATRRQDLPGGSDPHVVKAPCQMLWNMDTLAHWPITIHAFPFLSPCTLPLFPSPMSLAMGMGELRLQDARGAALPNSPAARHVSHVW